MKKHLTYLLSPLVALLFAACAKDDPAPAPPVSVSRTLLVYMAGDNNLVANGYDNLAAIRTAMAGYTASDARVVVYFDALGEKPQLLEVTLSGQQELYAWPSPQNSASGATLSEAISLTRELAPASRYGLVLWSHGVGWYPSQVRGYLTRSGSREADPWPVTKRDALLARGGVTAPCSTAESVPVSDPWPATKWFGQDISESPAGYLDTEELAAAIPDRLFDYILFDACYMASVEVLYALREKADYIISSPTEVISDGFPYGAIVRNLLQTTPDLEAVCESYYNYYANHPNASYRSATVSLVHTAKLSGLAAATANLYIEALAADPAVFSAFDISTVQHLDRYRRHFIFDLGSIAAQVELLVSPASVAAWRTQLAQTVIYEAHTEAFFDLPISVCCGLSSYLPLAAYADLNLYYQNLGWYKSLYSTE